MMPRSWLLRSACLALLTGSLPVAAQSAASPSPAAPSESPVPFTLASRLSHLATLAAELNHDLPSFECLETVISQDRHRGRVLRSVQFVADLRAQRTSDGSLNEAFTIQKVDGMDFTNGHFYTPVFVSGGFDRALRYFAADRQGCYRYTLSPGRIDFVGLPPAAAAPGCQEQGTTGFASLDPLGDPTHVERRVTLEAARVHRYATYSAIDLAPVPLNGRVYRLSRHAYSEVARSRDQLATFDATYSGCHLYSATITIHSQPDADSPTP